MCSARFSTFFLLWFAQKSLLFCLFVTNTARQRIDLCLQTHDDIFHFTLPFFLFLEIFPVASNGIYCFEYCDLFAAQNYYLYHTSVPIFGMALLQRRQQQRDQGIIHLSVAFYFYLFFTGPLRNVQLTLPVQRVSNIRAGFIAYRLNTALFCFSPFCTAFVRLTRLRSHLIVFSLERKLVKRLQVCKINDIPSTGCCCCCFSPSGALLVVYCGYGSTILQFVNA